MTTSEFVLGWLCVAVIVGMVVCIGVCLRLAYTKMELMLGHLNNSSMLSTLAPLRHGGPWGKLVLVGSIASVLTFSGFYLKRGLVSAEDLHHFPVLLKRKLVILQWIGLGLLLAMVGLAAVAKLGFVHA